MLPRKRDTSQSHTKGPFSGPAVTIMSCNVEGLSAAKEQLIADLRHRLQCAVVCIKETHRGPDAIRPSIPGMDLAIERPHSQYGSAIFRPANLENVFRGTFRVKKRDLPAKSGTVGRAHIEMFLEVGAYTAYRKFAFQNTL